MKKEFDFAIKGNEYILQDKSKKSGKGSFSISTKSLQFDTQKYYQIFFEDVTESIEVVINNCCTFPDDCLAEHKRKAEHVYELTSKLTNEICEKLNKECFAKNNYL